MRLQLTYITPNCVFKYGCFVKFARWFWGEN